MRRVTEEEWIEEYKKRGAYWMHSGDFAMPHALLTSGNHSNGFFNSKLICEDDQLLYTAGWNLLQKITPIVDFSRIECVVGPRRGATKLAEVLSIIITHSRGWPCSWASPEKREVHGQKSMVFSQEDLKKVYQKKVLLCEDVVTTGGSVERTVTATSLAGGDVAPFVLALVNRSDLDSVNDKRIRSLVTRHMPIWEPNDCPLCPKSKAIRPKDNWEELTGSKTMKGG